MLFVQFGCKLGAKTQRGQRSSDGSCLRLLDEIREAGCLLRLRPGAYSTLAIFDHSTEDDEAICSFAHLLVAILLFIPSIYLFFGLTIKIEVQHLSLDDTFWMLLTEPDETPLHRQVISKAIFGLDLHDMF